VNYVADLPIIGIMCLERLTGTKANSMAWWHIFATDATSIQTWLCIDAEKPI